MAALAEPFRYQLNPEIRDLREYRASHLNAVLAAEELDWRTSLEWDFAKSAELVRKFVDLGNLDGVVLVVGANVVGYAYHVVEDGKGLIGDVYLVPEHRTSANEWLLLNSLMDQISAVPRVEGQILMLSGELERPARHWTHYEVFRRAFLGLRLPMAHALEERPLPAYMVLQPWAPHDQEPAAQLIPATYQGHIDSRINDQYRSVAGARKFLHNIVQFPGCGEFHSEASFVGYDRRDGRLCGMVLSSLVAKGSGHITQLCVHPEYQSLGLGHELLRIALQQLERECSHVSLTVTVENRMARMLYERCGFRVLRKFAAYVWET